MILRDEGKTIERCLTSMIGLVDEYVLGIDSQCTDDTEAVVIKFFKDHPELQVNIYQYLWEDSFSKARNIGMDKATGTHILIMDGHEFFPERFFNITEKREVDNRYCFNVMKQTIDKEKCDDAHIHLYQQPFIGNTPNNYFMQPRIYRNDPSIRFNRDAHNTIMGTDREKSLNFPEIILIHDAPEDNRVWRKEQRIRMNTKALNADIEANPLDTRAMFYLGNTRMEAEDWSQAIYIFGRYLDICNVDHAEKYQVLLHKSIAHKALKEFKLARDSAILAVGVDPFRRDAYMQLGTLHNEEKDFEKAVFYFSQALTINPSNSRMFQNGPTSTWDPHQRIAVAYEGLGDKKRAIAHYKAALSYLKNKGWEDKVEELSERKKNILIIDHIGSFTKNLVERLRKSGEVNVMYIKEYDSQLVKWADDILCEWGDINALKCASTVPEKTTIRIHGYEAYTNKGILSQIDWSRIKKVVFVARHIKKMLSSIIPDEKCIVIPNGVDTEAFYIKNKDRDERNVGYAGYINEKKNPFLLLDIIKSNPDKRFNLRVDFQSPFWEETFKFELKDCQNVIYHPRYEKLSDFWNQIDSVVSTSIIESFSFNVAEAMACGCKPYIYNWKGAKEIWPEKWIYTERPIFSKTKDREEFRKYIINNYDESEMLPRLMGVICG